MKPVATFHSPFATKFGIPRQAGVVSTLPGTIVLEKPYRSPDALRGMEDFNYIWLIWEFSASAPSSKLMARPPRLGGNKQLGVFATRSPFRPNRLGLSSVRIEHIDYDTPDGPVIHVLGADLMDGTPIYDIKPYIPYTDSHPEAHGGFTDKVEWHPLNVVFTEEAKAKASRYIETLTDILAQDPRPHYHDDAERVYGMEYNGVDVHFKVTGNTLTVLDLTRK